MEARAIFDLYLFSRGAVGFALMVVGLSFAFEPKPRRSRRAFGYLFFSVGCLFTLDFIAAIVPLPADVMSALVIMLLLVLSQAMFETSVYLFGSEVRKGERRRALVVGLAWSGFLWAAPLLDYLFELPGEPLHAAAFGGRFLWPIVVAFLVFRSAKWKPADVPLSNRAIRPIGIGLSLILVIMSSSAISALVGSRILYIASQCALEALLIVWYYYIVAHPETFYNARMEIRKQHRRNTLLEDDEISLIQARLSKLVESEVYREAGLDLARLAKRLGVRAYRLSIFFNVHANASFPAWLNEQRIHYSMRRLSSEDPITVLDVALEA